MFRELKNPTHERIKLVLYVVITLVTVYYAAIATVGYDCPVCVCVCGLSRFLLLLVPSPCTLTWRHTLFTLLAAPLTAPHVTWFDVFGRFFAAATWWHWKALLAIS